MLFALLISLASCRDNDEPLVVYSGKGLKLAMDEIAASFEKETGTPVKLIYAGSNTLLSTIRKTQAGDIFVPGSQSYIKKAGDLITADGFVGYHVPTIAVSKQNQGKSCLLSSWRNPDTGLPQVTATWLQSVWSPTPS